MKENTFYGILYGASGSLWWGTIGVLYFKSVSFAGPIELVVHRTIWTAFSMIITTTLFSKWDNFFNIIKRFQPDNLRSLINSNDNPSFIELDKTKIIFPEFEKDY